MLICVFAVIFLLSDVAPPYTAAGENIRPKRMIGGRDTTIEEHPYQVAVEYDNYEYKCSGAILSKYYVLTAAHCINVTANETKIRSGSSLRSEGGILHDVTDVKVHKLYSLNKYSNSDYDIGVVRVDPPFSYDETRQPIPLYEDAVSSNFTTDEKLVISGWGSMDHDENLSDQLQTMDVPWISKKLCNESYAKFDGIRDGQICTGYLGERDKDICSGDSGAPLIFQGKVIGVAAYTEGRCGRLDYPAVYTEVAYFLDWIKEHVEFDD
ncbi:trypsin-1-like [Copidosoma floridanum]|uniref:trypsin-1-like n=1 Tax=Copidosoma floridanum TaxID=29053 RepID=UPI0006C9A38E|nr:trypsin-1-like [Copidosoma floridanum]